MIIFRFLDTHHVYKWDASYPGVAVILGIFPMENPPEMGTLFWESVYFWGIP